MLDEEKIRLMTQISIYEKNEELRDLEMSKFRKEDYVKFGCLKTLIAVTFAYWLCIGVYVLLKFEEVLNNLNTMDYFSVVSKLMGGYVLAMVIFYLYAFVVYNFKYMKAKPRLIQHNRNLKKLVKLYKEDEAHEQVLTGEVKVYSEIGGFDEDFDNQTGDR